ncbi:RNA 2',3'-cyclic phosphodiesterase [soil metagenome]
MIRLFAAVAVPDEAATPLLAAQTGLREARWRPREALHVTLRFFGDVQETVAEDLDAALAAIALPPFDLQPTGAGAFGASEHMRAVWAGVADSEPLKRLAAKCETAARRAGLKAEARAYHPHVTLAYLPRTADPAAVAGWIADNALLKAPAFAVKGFGLYSSRLSANGSTYDLERFYPLR